MLIVEAVDATRRRMSVGEREKVAALGDISIYTEDGGKPLTEVFEAVKSKEEGRPVGFNPKKILSEELRGYFASVLPGYDRARVHDNDMRKIFSWYNILVENGVTDFAGKREDQPAAPEDGGAEQ